MSTITWYGHSAFRITSPHEGKERHLCIDPFLTPASGVTVDSMGPLDVVLVTHDHADHVGEAVALCRKSGAMLGAIVGTAETLVERGLPQAQLLNGIGFNMGGTVEHAGFAMTMVPAFHSSQSGCPAGYIIRTPDGLTVYHAGDTCVFSGMALWGQLHAIDVALLPVGGVFTMDAPQAALACSLLGCKQVIPMHWGTFPVLAQSTAAFKEELARRAPACRCLDLAPGQSIYLSDIY